MRKPDNLNKLPDFIVIGAPKAGTTSLHEYLRQNPRISLPVRKETHFFIFDQSASPVNEDFGDRILTNPISNLDEYLKEFENKPEADHFGEVCPSYLSHPLAAENIHKYIPDTKIICILRDPVDRFFSTFTYRTARDQEVRSFDDIMSAIKSGNYDPSIERALDIGKYHLLLSRYYRLFPKENIKIFLFEDLLGHPKQLMDDLMDFIGLPEYPYNLSGVFNRSGSSKFDWLYKSLVRSRLGKILRKALSASAYQKIRNLFERLVFRQSSRISTEHRTFLQNYYRSDLRELQDLINKDLTNWIGQA